MDIKKYLSILICTTCILFVGCSDGITEIGTSIQPDEDKVAVYEDTFYMKASTIMIDSFSTKSSIGQLGELYDPQYGRLKSDYLFQFYCKEDYQFAHTPKDGKIDSITLIAKYNSWTGDQLASLRASVFPLTKQPEKKHNNKIIPADYCDMQQNLGNKVFTVISNPLETEMTSQGRQYVRKLKINLPKELGQKIYDETINNRGSFKNQAAFNRFFPGLYLTTDYGSGIILQILETEMSISYLYDAKTTNNSDTILRARENFLVTREVIQVNHYENEDTETILAENDKYTFLKTPGGIYTQLVIPAKDIASATEGRMINNLNLLLKYEPEGEIKSELYSPPFLLLLPEDSLYSFFDKKKREDNVTSFISSDNVKESDKREINQGFNPSAHFYSFRNISNLLNKHIKESPDQDLRLLVVPVNRSSLTEGASMDPNQPNYNIGLQYLLSPSGLKLYKDKENLRITILSSKFKR